MENNIPGLRTILRFSGLNKIYSVIIPEVWNIEQFIQFINYSFKDETNEKNISIYFGSKKITDFNLPIKNFYNKKDILQFIILTKKIKDQDNDKSNFFKSQSPKELVKYNFI